MVIVNPGGSSIKLSKIESTRYQWAARFCVDKRVLDFGCGHGEGASILAGSASSVLGYDIDQGAIHYARRFAGKNLLFTDEFTPASWGLFDVVVALEVIEHLEDGKRFLEAVKYVLYPNGELILSTPNKAYTRKHGLNNPFHLKEYYPAEIMALLIDSGFSIRPYSQSSNENIILNRLAPLTPVKFKNLWHKIHRFPVRDDFLATDPVQLYHCRVV